MDRKLGGLILFALLLPLAGEAKPPPADTTTDELCTMYAITMLTGRPMGAGLFSNTTQAEIAEAVAARQATCDPIDRYMDIAKYRIALWDERAQQNIRNYQQLQDRMMNQYRFGPPPPPLQQQTQTRCSRIGDHVLCTTSP